MVTIDELMALLQRALEALVPTMDLARIPWRDGTAYDDWDRVSNALYESIVVDSIRFGLGEEPDYHLAMPKYGTAYRSYAELSYVEVHASGNTSDRRLAFESFGTTVEPFDTVRCRAIDQSGAPLGPSVPVTLEGARFELFLRSTEAGDRRVNRLSVAL